ncbi:hypothetical protein MferCBS31731_005706 [Microsporum ferrugineum]
MEHQQQCYGKYGGNKSAVQSNTIPSDSPCVWKDDMVDRAAVYLTQTFEYPPLTPEAEKALVKKIDWIILPMLLLTATLGAVDKVALGTAALYGLREDLGLRGQTYAWAGSILPIGAIVGMWPSSYLVHRFPSAKYLCICSIGWSAVTLLLPTCTGGHSLLALRFIMGFLEAIIVPGISLLIAGFYKKREQPPRNAIVFSAFSSVINGFLSYTVGRIPPSAPLRLWQYLFLIVGSVSMAWSIFALIFLPNSPMDARFLTDEEKYHAVRRLAENKTGIVNKRWKWNQVVEAILDPKTWIIFLFNVAINIPNGGNLIGPQTFRDSQAPAYTSGFIAMLICYCSCIFLMAMYWGLAVWMNKSATRARVSVACDGSQVEGPIDQFLDKSDFKQVNFKYTT